MSHPKSESGDAIRSVLAEMREAWDFLQPVGHTVPGEAVDRWADQLEAALTGADGAHSEKTDYEEGKRYLARLFALEDVIRDVLGRLETIAAQYHERSRSYNREGNLVLDAYYDGKYEGMRKAAYEVAVTLGRTSKPDERPVKHEVHVEPDTEQPE